MQFFPLNLKGIVNHAEIRETLSRDLSCSCRYYFTAPEIGPIVPGNAVLARDENFPKKVTARASPHGFQMRLGYDRYRTVMLYAIQRSRNFKVRD